MGGYGSGRRGGKGVTNDHRALDVRHLQRKGLLTPGRSFGWSWLREGETVASIQVRTEANRVILDYRHKDSGGEWVSANYPVLLEWTACNLGGRRAWFRCPVNGCGRRVAILYSGAIFACRHCLNLAYECQRENDGDRAMRRAGTIQRRIGLGGGLLGAMDWRRPKGMHWRTYARLTAKHDAFVRVALAGMEVTIDKATKRLDEINDMYPEGFTL